MTEPSTLEILNSYLLVTASYWWFLFVGVLMPLPDIYKHFQPHGMELPLRRYRWIRWTASLLCLSLAQFLAYRNQTLNLARVIEQKRQFSMTINAQASELQQAKGQIENLRAKLPTRESPDSLRRRTVRLADAVYNFLIERQQHHPPPAYPDSSDPNPSEERRRAIKLCQDYDQETFNQYMRRYRDPLVGIVKEYEAKGIPTRYLENDFKQRVPGAVALGSDWEGSPMDELNSFRALAYRVDAHDNTIHF